MARYALINNGVVHNVVVGDEEFITELLNQQVYDEAIEFDPEVTVVRMGFSYAGGVFSPPLVAVGVAKAQKLAEFKVAVQEYIDSKYDFNTRQQLANLFMLAKFQLKLNRAAYLQPLLEWIDSVLTYSQHVVSTVSGMSDPVAIANMSWSFDANVMTDPKLTLAGAIAIVD